MNNSFKEEDEFYLKSCQETAWTNWWKSGLDLIPVLGPTRDFMSLLCLEFLYL